MSAMQPFDNRWWKLRRLGGALSRFLSPAHKRQLYKVSLWACGLSALEMFVAAAVIPYVGCLSGQCPAVIETTLQRLGWSEVPTLSLALFSLICLKLVVQALLAWSGARFNQQVQRDTVSRLLESYLHLDWKGFSSESRTHYFRRCATTAVDAAYVSQQCITMISSLLMLVFLSALMLWQYPLVSVLLAVGFLLLNVAVQVFLGRSLKRAAEGREQALQRWSTRMSDAFAAFRELRVYGLERFFLQHIEQSINALADSNVKLTVFPTLPRLVLDFAVLGILLLLVSLWMLLKRPLGELLPPLIFYAVVARALLPAMMNVLSTRTALFGAVLSIELVLGELERSATARTERVGVRSEVGYEGRFIFDRVTFAHAPQLPPVFSDIELQIVHPSWVAIVGPSGAGKSTLMELLCGIQQPQVGEIRYLWPEGLSPRVAYVPQHVTLLDDSIEQNVVFGFDEGDSARVDSALRLACLDAVVARLPEGRHAQVGAEGAALSGGERQRLSLARALYRQPDLLLLDEATSGLDEATETRLLAQLRSECPAMSVVYITHRSGNLRFADRTLRVHNGTLDDVTVSGA